MKHHVFISYSHSREDSRFMKRIKNFLEDAFIKVWTDEKLTPGTPEWTLEVEQAIENTGIVVVLTSPSSKKSEWVVKEILHAMRHRKTIIPVLIHGEEQQIIGLILENMQHIDVREEFELNAALLAIIVGKKLKFEINNHWEKKLPNIKIRRVKELTNVIEIALAIRELDLQKWIYSPLSEVADFYNQDRVQVTIREDQANSISNKEEGEIETYPYYGATGIIDYIDYYKFDGRYILFTARGASLYNTNLNLAFQAEGKFTANESVHVLSPKGGILYHYLLHALNTLDIRSLVTGSTIPNLPKKTFEQTIIPIRPINEQHLIVEYLYEVQNEIQKIKQLQLMPILKDDDLFRMYLKQVFPIQENS